MEHVQIELQMVHADDGLASAEVWGHAMSESATIITSLHIDEPRGWGRSR